ncbi:MAG: glycine betaine ABC transporter substrate-binding protein [Betaproteobacteria bacterium]
MLCPSARADSVNLGHVNVSFYEASANVIALMLERSGWNVALKSGSHANIYPKIADGQLDLFVAAWLPYAHANYWAQYQENLVKLGPLFDDAKLYWAVPAYIPEAALKSVADLTRPEVAGKMVKTIRGTLPDSGLMIGSNKIFERYGLAAAGYELVPGSNKEWQDTFKERIAKGEWFVMPLWQPQYLNRAYELRILEEPEKILGGANTAYLVANKAFAAKLPRKMREMLSRIELSNKAVTQMDYWVNVDNMTPRQAARRWIGSHAITVTYWIEGPEED